MSINVSKVKDEPSRSTVASVDLVEMEERMAQYRRHLAHSRTGAERELCDWFAGRGISLTGLTDGAS